jgi:hypothetical protein
VEIIAGSVPQWTNDYGYGGGSGYGYGCGYDYGYGYGDGYGYGSGDGSGYGSGYGYDYGYGYGDGYGSGDYWRAAILTFARKWPNDQQTRLSNLQAEGATIAYWLSDAAGRACNGGSNHPVKPGDVEETSGPLLLCHDGTLHATLSPMKWSGCRWWIVALTGKVVGNDEKLGALRREIIGECL